MTVFRDNFTQKQYISCTINSLLTLLSIQQKPTMMKRKSKDYVTKRTDGVFDQSRAKTAQAESHSKYEVKTETVTISKKVPIIHREHEMKPNFHVLPIKQNSDHCTHTDATRTTLLFLSTMVTRL